MNGLDSRIGKDKATSFLIDVAQIRNQTMSKNTPWVFGTQFATALDAHLMIFLARLMDVGRDELIPRTELDYAQRVMSMDVWKCFMQGRKTMYAYTKG